VRGQQWTVLPHLRRLAGADAGDLSDRQLLDRFTVGRDEDAFAALVRRHGPLVWGACWRRLRHVEDAEDCFQATFLVLARKAGSVRWHESVANWLHEVASRVAAEAQARNVRRRLRERTGLDPETAQPAPRPAGRELCMLLDDELNRLPDKYRAPLLLCYLEGRTTDQAARQLGWSQRTFERRLAQGRERLRARLTRQGLTLSGVLLTAALSAEAARAALPIGLVPATVRAAAGPSPAVVALVDGTVHALTLTKTRLIAGVLVLLTATAGVGLLLGQVPGAQHEAGPAASEPAASPTPVGGDEGKRDEAPAATGDLAARVWAITEVVRQHHVKPPSRQEMLVAAARALLKAAAAAPPEDLARRAADVASEAQLRAFLRDSWPAEGAADGKLEAALLEGLFESIPGKPSLLSEDYVRRADQLSSNRYVGVGIQLAVNKTEQVPEICVPFRHGTAYQAGAKPGDLLLAVDGKSTRGIDLQQVVDWVRGQEGTPVTLVVRQAGAAEARTLKVNRAVIPLDSILGFRRPAEDRWDYCADREARIGYLWVDSLKTSTLHELRQAERRLQADGMRALVLDFRYSAGEGVLDHAALVADGLLDGGLMWTAHTTSAGDRAYRADRECLFRGWPIAVLVNNIGDNAQGAVLAALQDNNRATLVGEPTQTDGSIRMIYQLPGSKEAITVLTGQLERAAPGRGWPVVPDKTVGTTPEQRAAVERWLRAKQLPDPPPAREDRPPEDPQLAYALGLLREALKTARP
jgi:C-terminal peptidase prc